MKTKIMKHAYRSALAMAIVGQMLLFWLNGAVGIIGSANNRVNMLYLGVHGVWLMGSVIVLFKPAGMFHVMLLTAVAQVLVIVLALIPSMGFQITWWPWDAVVLTVFFAGLWVVSAWLFRCCARTKATGVGNAE